MPTGPRWLRAGRAVVYVHTDVTNEGDIPGSDRDRSRAFRRLDCLFNNAGVGVWTRPSEKPTPSSSTRRSHCCFARWCSHEACGADHEAAGSGTIINTASVAGMRTGFGPHVYSALKAAVIHLTVRSQWSSREWCASERNLSGGIVTPIFGRSLGLPAIQAEERLPFCRRSSLRCSDQASGTTGGYRRCGALARRRLFEFRQRHALVSTRRDRRPRLVSSANDVRQRA